MTELYPAEGFVCSEKEGEVSFIILPSRRFIFGLALLSLAAVHAAAAQREDTISQNSELKKSTAVPDDPKHQAVIARATSDAWAPPDIDVAQPSTVRTGNCPLQDVISQAGIRIEELVHNVDRFSATEVIQHQSVNRSGNLQRPEIQTFNYVYSMKEGPDGYVISEENRRQSRGTDGFPGQVQTLGSPGLVLTFHPKYVKNFRMTCEGLGAWGEQPAWQIRFEQLPDADHRMSIIVMDGKSYDVRFRGVAWILKDSYQIVHMEMDLAETIPKIRLRLDHQVIDYLPVSFPDSDTKIWLPSSAELYLDFRGHRFYRRHSYMNFRLFSVKVEQQFGASR
jgi:hypothetical protein